ncbi:hypothetical protein PHET_11622 [Paragonimus heterotremus]|uniref:Uncharacterized protein n=1 Tax=Paragonimus heterotremus TaxID=100268 RepID=A0A8J4SQ40_9TREM|nr:hypothetical protein PHET_11622 [Paragonimus heterotremus]
MTTSTRLSGSDDEYVVPHMDIACLQNSLAYQKVLEEPWTYLHNWNTLAPSVQQELAHSFMNTLGEMKTEMAVTQGLFDPYTVNQYTAQYVEEPQPENGSTRPVASTSSE